MKTLEERIREELEQQVQTAVEQEREEAARREVEEIRQLADKRTAERRLVLEMAEFSFGAHANALVLDPDYGNGRVNFHFRGLPFHMGLVREADHIYVVRDLQGTRGTSEVEYFPGEEHDQTRDWRRLLLLLDRCAPVAR